MASFLSNFNLEASFAIVENKNYIATHFTDANCADEVTQANVSDGLLTVNEVSFGYKMKQQTGEEMACTAEVIYALELIEVPANLSITKLFITKFPYHFATEFHYIDVVPYDGSALIQ